MAKRSFFRPLLARLKGISPHRRPGPVSDNPQWHGLPQKDLDRIAARIRRLSDSYRRRWRMDGNMTIPVFQRMEEGRIYTRSAREAPSPLTLFQFHQSHDPAQLDTLFRTILIQLDQLQSLSFVHGALSEDSLILHENAHCLSASIKTPVHGRFTDEPVNSENLILTPHSPPEMLRCIEYPNADDRPDDDMFAAGCLYHQLLSGAPPDSFGMPAAKALCSAIAPDPDPKIDPVRSMLIRCMLSPDPSRRPTAAEVLDALNELQQLADSMQDPGVHIVGSGEQWYFIRTLRWPWKSEPSSSPLIQRQQAFHARDAGRLGGICSRSRAWNAQQPLILPCVLDASSTQLRVTTPFTAQRALRIHQLHDYERSPFLLDARFIDMLMSAHALHSDGHILGALSADSFFADISPGTYAVHLADLTTVLPLDALPPPEDLLPSAQASMLLSPELSQYITAPSAAQADEARRWIGPASDIFALGALYHLLLTGELPRPASPAHGTLANAVAHAENAGDALILHDDLDAPHRQLILEMLSQDPSERPARCDRIAHRIMDFYTT